MSDNAHIAVKVKNKKGSTCVSYEWKRVQFYVFGKQTHVQTD